MRCTHNAVMTDTIKGTMTKLLGFEVGRYVCEEVCFGKGIAR